MGAREHDVIVSVGDGIATPRTFVRVARFHSAEVMGAHFGALTLQLATAARLYQRSRHSTCLYHAKPSTKPAAMDDDWCHLSDDDEFVTVAPSLIDSESEPEVELEPELVPATLLQSLKTAPPTYDDAVAATTANQSSDANNDTGISLDDIDISTLLQDAPALQAPLSPERQVARAFVASLLAPEHLSCRLQVANSPHVGRCVEQHAAGSAVAVVRKRHVRLAFREPRLTSFPARLRAAMPSRQVASDTVASSPMLQPTRSPVRAITRDQGTQVDAHELLEPPSELEPRAARLQSALDRSMQTAVALKSKSEAHERLEHQLRNADAAIARSEHRHERDAFKLERLASGLELAKQREQRHVQQHAQQTNELATLRIENAALQRAAASIDGRLDDLETLSIDQLEQLELALAARTDSVRAAMRRQYKQAIALRDVETRCVVCLSAPATVLLLPCRHQVVCSTCALRVSTCPIDRERIQDKKLAFGLQAFAA